MTQALEAALGIAAAWLMVGLTGLAVLGDCGCDGGIFGENYARRPGAAGGT